jgi:hypothetical protein
MVRGLSGHGHRGGGGLVRLRRPDRARPQSDDGTLWPAPAPEPEHEPVDRHVGPLDEPLDRRWLNERDPRRELLDE